MMRKKRIVLFVFSFLLVFVSVGIFAVSSVLAQSNRLGDVDGDRDIDIFDFMIALSRNDISADVNNDGTVNIYDMNYLVSSFATFPGRPDPTNSPTPIIATPTIGGATPTPPPGGNIQPYASAPACEDHGVVHDNRTWHGIWNYEYGCHWDHEHKRNPHDLDDIFGTEIYSWFGSNEGRLADLSYPWETYAGAGPNFEAYVPGTATENAAKHQGYHWLYFRDKDSSTGALTLGSNTLTDARVIYHQVGGQVGALTRFHSTYLQVRGCNADQVVPASQGVVTSTCGTYFGGGWLDFGRLNYPNRGDYEPLPGDPPEFYNSGAELAPYRIHAVGQNSLDSWQSEGNEYNFLPSDPTGSRRLMVGHGIHFDLGESTGETDSSQFGNPNPSIHFWCVDPVTNLITCDNNNSAAALFRTWVKIPVALDGSKYDQDASNNGYFSFDGYTNRYADITAYTTSNGQQVNEPGSNCWSTGPGLDCVPTQADHFPIGNCTADRCKAAYRGSLEDDLYDADLAEPLGVWWIKYPN